MRDASELIDSPEKQRAYCYILGLYLGDGYLARFPRAWCLRILFDARYPRLIDEAKHALGILMPSNRVWSARRAGMNCVVLGSYSQRWAELLPQHGRGRKHERAIVLADWQLASTHAHPRALIRGLLHSDGSRFVNRVRTAKREYAYPSYAFTNASADIRRIFCDHLDTLGIAWRRGAGRNVSVARREAVAALDAFVGPKA